MNRTLSGIVTACLILYSGGVAGNVAVSVSEVITSTEEVANDQNPPFLRQMWAGYRDEQVKNLFPRVLVPLYWPDFTHRPPSIGITIRRNDRGYDRYYFGPDEPGLLLPTAAPEGYL